MTSKPSSSATALQLRLIEQAARKSAAENDNDSGMLAAAERARRLSEKAQKFATKAMREGKAGLVTDGKGTFAIVEK